MRLALLALLLAGPLQAQTFQPRAAFVQVNDVYRI